MPRPEDRRPKQSYEQSKVYWCICMGFANGILWWSLIADLNSTHASVALLMKVWFILINIITLAVNSIDKKRAQSEIDVSRVPEKVLHALTFVGGAPATAAAMLLLRHKSIKVSYQITYLAVSGLHFAALLLPL